MFNHYAAGGVAITCLIYHMIGLAWIYGTPYILELALEILHFILINRSIQVAG